MNRFRLLLVLLLTSAVAYACGSPNAVTPTPLPSDGGGGVVLLDASPHIDVVEARLDLRPDAAADAAAAGIVLLHRGVNLSGGEFGKGCTPARYGPDYSYPTHAEIDLMASRRVNHLRVPFCMERVQPKLQGPIDEGEWVKLFDPVAYAASKGMTVAIEPHNFGRYNNVVLTELQIGDFWGRIAQRFIGNDKVWLDLMNEPHDMATETWLKLAQASVREIRRVGFTGRILVPGNGWSGAGSWTSSWYGTSNAIAMLAITDANVVFTVHLYLDTDASGKGTECVSETIGEERLVPFVSSMKQHGRLGYLGELGAPITPRCERAIAKTLAALEAEPTVWIGWAWWSAGRRWGLTYPLTVQPILFDAGAGVVHLGADRPQMEWLRPYLYRNMQ